MLRFYTAGESHGQRCWRLSPAAGAIPIDVEFINEGAAPPPAGLRPRGPPEIESHRRKALLGCATEEPRRARRFAHRKPRLANWEKILPVEASEDDPGTEKTPRTLARPRRSGRRAKIPLSTDARYILERASAR